VILFPNAKINIGLYVESKRSDGYHNIQSIFYPIPWNDVIEFRESSDFQMTSTGLKIDGDFRSNLIYKAWKLMNAEFHVPPVELHLLKNIPMGAGLGGGSADAAFLMKALNSQFGLDISTEDLQTLSARIGSDCPFFIENKACLVSGRGEIMKVIDLDLSDSYAVVIHPDIHVSTADAYAGIELEDGHFDLHELRVDNKSEWKDEIHNSFENSLIPRFPQIQEIKDELYRQGAYYASMTGSGSSVYGLFTESVEIENLRRFGQARILKL